MSTGREIRLGRLFGAAGKAVVVACDHGMFDGPHAGTESIPEALERLGDGPDAILLSPGVLPLAAGYFGRPEAPDEFHEEIKIGCRMLYELGADCIKTFYTNNFSEVTATSPVPVLGLGAEKTPTDLDALSLAEKEIRDGAGGVVFGRNAIQASDPAAFVSALQDIVKRGATAQDACSKHGLTA